MNDDKKLHLKLALWFSVGSVLISLAFGGFTVLVNFLFGNDTTGMFWRASKLIFLSFGPALLLGILFSALGVFKDYEWVLSSCLYYGTLIISGLLEDKWFGEKVTLYLISAAISLALAFVVRGVLRWGGGKRNG